MTLPSSGPLAFSQIQSEFGGSNPISLSEYYRGGGLVPSHSNTSGIPSSGTISVNQFYGKSATAPGATSLAHTLTIGQTTVGVLQYGYNQSSGLGGLSPNPNSNNLNTGLRMTFRYIQWTVSCKTNFEFSYLPIAGPTDGTGWSSVTLSGSYSATFPRSDFTISGGGNSSTYIQAFRAASTNAPTGNTTATFTVNA